METRTQWLSQRAAWRVTPGRFTSCSGHTALICLISLKAKLVQFPSRLMDFSYEASKEEVCGPLYVVVSQGDWQQRQTPTITALNCFSGWELQSCLVAAIKFWTFSSAVPVNTGLTCSWQKTEDSSTIPGNWSFLLLENTVEILFIISHVWVLSVQEPESTLVGSVLKVCLSSSLPSFAGPPHISAFSQTLKQMLHFLYITNLLLLLIRRTYNRIADEDVKIESVRFKVPPAPPGCCCCCHHCLVSSVLFWASARSQDLVVVIDGAGRRTGWKESHQKLCMKDTSITGSTDSAPGCSDLWPQLPTFSVWA